MANTESDIRTAKNSMWAIVTGAEPEERRLLAISFFYFLCVLASYYMLRPLRDQFSAAVGSTNLWQFWVGTFLVMLALTPVFGSIVSKFPREKFVPAIYIFFILCIAAFVPAFAIQDRIGPRLLGIIFYVWVSTFNLFVVSVFWSLMADIFDAVQAKRLFPVIALGGTVGAILGPLIARSLPVQTLLIAAGVALGIALLCIFALLNMSKNQRSILAGKQVESEVIGGDIFAGLKQVFTSPFLRKMAVLMLLGDAIATVAYGLGADYIGAHYADRESRKTVYANIDLVTNILQVILQVGVTRWILLRLGAGYGLVIPAVLNAILAVICVFAGEASIILMLIATRAGTYGMNKPAVDSLYTRVHREAKYKGKNFIETTVWRFGDVLVSLAMKGLSLVGVAFTGYALICVGVASMAGYFGWHAAKSPDLLPESKETD
ncbi:MAG: translocase [Arenimonas sp.]